MAKEQQQPAEPDIESIYKSMAKQHTLPEYDAINFDFEIEVLEDTSYFIRQVRMRMLEKVGYFSKMIEELLNPDSVSLVQLYEYRYLTEEEKSLLYNWLKKCMAYDRKGDMYMLAPDDKKEAQLIRELFHAWQLAKKDLLPVLQRISDAWINGVESKDEQARYLG